MNCAGGEGEDSPEAPASADFLRRSAPPELSPLVGTLSKALITNRLRDPMDLGFLSPEEIDVIALTEGLPEEAKQLLLHGFAMLAGAKGGWARLLTIQARDAPVKPRALFEEPAFDTKYARIPSPKAISIIKMRIGKLCHEDGSGKRKVMHPGQCV